MDWKSLLSISLLMVIIGVSCKNTVNTNDKKADKKGISQEKPKAESFKTIAIAQSLSNILPSCEESEYYKKEVWPGKNSCSWALDKEFLRNLPEYVKRGDNGLSFQTDQSEWRLLAPETSNHHLLINAYLPKSHIFVLKYYGTNQCPEYWIYDPKADRTEKFKGNFYLSPTESHFAIVSNSSCSDTNILGKFSKSSGIKTVPIENNKTIQSLKWGQKSIGFATNRTESAHFQSLVLP